ncbi:MAG TPA: phage tail protein, partial [Thermoanaerobaculia bacterium]|nr:phage tail protein [Thermoanaerobaculia bacterium]
GMQAAFYQWIKNTIEGNFSRTTDGKIVAYDSTNKPIRTLEFYDAQITEVTFPRLDASSKEAAAMTVQITPSATWSSSGGDPFPGTVSKTQKKWLASNFRLAIDGVDMTKASSVEALRVAIPLGYPQGIVCSIICPPPLAINFPNVEVRLASSFASSAIKWYEESVYNGFAEEKNGAIEYLTPDAKGVLFRLTLHNLGPISIENDDGGSIAATILRMYAEHMKFEIATGVN